MKHDAHIWRTGDGRHVPHGHLDAAILAYPAGDDVPDHVLAELAGDDEAAEVASEVDGHDEEETLEDPVEEVPEVQEQPEDPSPAVVDPVDEPAQEPKAKAPAANKARKSAGDK